MVYAGCELGNWSNFRNNTLLSVFMFNFESCSLGSSAKEAMKLGTESSPAGDEPPSVSKDTHE